MLKLPASVKIYKRGEKKHQVSRHFDDTPPAIHFIYAALYRLHFFGHMWTCRYEYDHENDIVWVSIVWWSVDKKAKQGV